MALQNIQNHDMNLVLSSDAKPRLKWTPLLHQRFVDAVNQLGGPEKATPKSLRKVMGIRGLTLYHLKSHLQKYRLGKSEQITTFNETKEEAVLNNAEYVDDQKSDFSTDYCIESQTPINESLQITHALQMQMEVQRKLHEQIEVQRHLQLRIEAQGKYLQSVLIKAQDTLAGYNSSSVVEVEIAKAELSRLVSMVNNGCPSSSVSVLTDLDCPSSRRSTERKPMEAVIGGSLESSLTSSVSSWRKEGIKQVTNGTNESNKSGSIELSLMEMNSNHGSERKRSGSTISDGNCGKRLLTLEDEINGVGKLRRFDLNSSVYE